MSYRDWRIRYAPHENMQGHWVVDVCVDKSFGMWLPATSRSSRESAEMYVATRREAHEAEKIKDRELWKFWKWTR